MRRFFSLLGQIYDQLIHMQMLQVNDLFNGSSSSMQALWKIIDGGTFTLFDGDNTLFDYHEEIRNFFFFFFRRFDSEGMGSGSWIRGRKGDGYLKRFRTPMFP